MTRTGHGPRDDPSIETFVPGSPRNVTAALPAAVVPEDVAEIEGVDTADFGGGAAEDTTETGAEGSLAGADTLCGGAAALVVAGVVGVG